MPNRLYRYCPINVNTLKTISLHELWFCEPVHFNDPYDCWVKVLPPQSDEAIEARINELLAHFREEFFNATELSRAEWKSILRSKMIDPDSRRNFFQSSVNKGRSKFGISCFSIRNDDVLMYSHYADYHKGLCIEFDSSGESFFAEAEPVEYCSEPRIVDLEKETIETLMHRQVLTKHSMWSYESEYRMIKPEQPGPMTFPPEALTGITFGCRVSESDIQLVQAAVAGRKKAVNFYQAHPKTNGRSDFDIIEIG